MHFSLAGSASLGNARQFAEVTGGVLRSWRVPEARVQALELAVAEMATNVCKHGFSAEERGSMRLELDWDADGLRVAISDSGRPFDPRVIVSAPEPDPADASTWPERGLGLAFIRAAGRLDYRSDARGNVFTVIVTEPMP
jgi:anti-sigma regulatory factor (Ser/Thr protein kinase)